MKSSMIRKGAKRILFDKVEVCPPITNCDLLEEIEVNSALIGFYWNPGKDISEKCPDSAHRLYGVYASYLQQLAEGMATPHPISTSDTSPRAKKKPKQSIAGFKARL